MRSSLSHRGDIGCLDLSFSAVPGVHAVVDSPVLPAQQVSVAWAAASGDAQRFAAGLRGPLAAGVVDAARRMLVLVRDRLGEKPLYYTAGARGVAFASEIKALVAAGSASLGDLDPTALDAFLAFTYIPAPWTIFRNVRTVPAGHVVTVDYAGLESGRPPVATVVPYWRLPDRQGAGADSGEMLRRLAGALERRLPSGGDRAVMLSGGLDSSVVTMLASRAAAGGRRLHTFSASFGDARLDESAHAARVASLAGAVHHRVEVGDVGPDLVRRVLFHLDQPMADAATIPTWLVCREVASVSRVALTGDGADALLAGDHWFRRVRDLDRIERMPRAARMAVSAAAALGGPARYRKRAALERLAALPGARRYLEMRQKWTPQERRAVYLPEFAREVDFEAVDGTYLNAPVSWRPGESVDAATRLDARHGLPEGLLMKGDKMAGSHGIETRSPFVDPEFASWCASLDIDLLLKGGTGKRLLKTAAETLLPRDLVRRRKQGLQVPMGRWLKGSLRELTERAFDPGNIARQGVFDPAALQRLRARFMQGGGPALDGQVWQIVALHAWWEQAVSRESAGC